MANVNTQFSFYAFIALILLSISAFSSDSIYIEGYEPDPSLPEANIRKIYLLIENGKISKKSLKPFEVSEETKKITETETGMILLSSGFIDLHGHLKYNVIPLWQEAAGQFDNRFTWRSKSSYKNNVTRHLSSKNLGSSKDPNSLLCQTYQYAEIKALIGGVTSVQGVGADRGCTTGILARNVEIQSDYEEKTEIRVSTEMVNPNITQFFQEAVFPKMIEEKKSFDEVTAHMTTLDGLLSSSQKFYLEGYKGYVNYFKRIFPLGNIRTFIAHLSEGRAQDAYNKLEYKLAKTMGLAQKGLVIIHGVGLDEADMKHAASQEMSIVWSPFSNLLLYGETLNLKLANKYGINLTLGSDWSPSGSKNLLDEVKIARNYVKKNHIKFITDKDLYEMMTIRPAKALKLEHKIGRLEENYLADIVAIKLKSLAVNPYTQIIAAEPSDIQVVMVGGKVVVGKKTVLNKLDIKSNPEDSVLVNNEVQNNILCAKYKNSFVVNAPLSIEALTHNLKNTFSVLDEVTSCSDLYYQNTVKNLFSAKPEFIVADTGNAAPPRNTPKQSYRVLSEQMKAIELIQGQ
ncbi:MAG: amidohydrolase family protein [Pseudobdellovibrio sp.]